MAVSPTYPGVYIEEVSSGVHTIIGVSTSITAFLGRTAQGPTNAARTLTSFADFERTFGQLDPAYPLGYAVFDFFTRRQQPAVVGPGCSAMPASVRRRPWRRPPTTAPTPTH